MVRGEGRGRGGVDATVELRHAWENQVLRAKPEIKKEKVEVDKTVFRNSYKVIEAKQSLYTVVCLTICTESRAPTDQFELSELLWR